MHVAATYDGQDIRLYVDGILESSVAAPGLVIGSNDHALSFGAQDNGTKPFDGALDQVHLFDFALTESAIQGSNRLRALSRQRRPSRYRWRRNARRLGNAIRVRPLRPI